MEVDHDQAAYWAGVGGTRWAADADRYDEILGAFDEPILTAARLRGGDVVLDIGCGTGALTRAAHALVQPTGTVVGIDVSPPMLRTAAERSTGCSDVSFILGNAESYVFDRSDVDAVISRFGVMFFDDPVAAFRNIAAALKPGARVAFACWRGVGENDWILKPAMTLLAHARGATIPPAGPGPFAFADEETVRRLLEAAGFGDTHLSGLDVSLWLGDSVDTALEFYKASDMAAAVLRDADPATIPTAWDAVRSDLARDAGGGPVRLGAGAWVVSAVRNAAQP